MTDLIIHTSIVATCLLGMAIVRVGNAGATETRRGGDQSLLVSDASATLAYARTSDAKRGTILGAGERWLKKQQEASIKREIKSWLDYFHVCEVIAAVLQGGWYATGFVCEGLTR